MDRILRIREKRFLISKSGGKGRLPCREDIVYAMDAAASELYDEARGVYVFPESQRKMGKNRRSQEVLKR